MLQYNTIFYFNCIIHTAFPCIKALHVVQFIDGNGSVTLVLFMLSQRLPEMTDIELLIKYVLFFLPSSYCYLLLFNYNLDNQTIVQPIMDL